MILLAVLGCAAEPAAPIDAGSPAMIDARMADGGEPADAGAEDASAWSDAALDASADTSPDAGTPSSPLAAHRDRLLDSLAARRGATRCATWTAMNATERGVFLLITDLLGKRTRTSSGAALEEVEALLAVRGQEQCELRCCGGGEHNRLYLVASPALIAALRAPALPPWRPSRDLAGPHPPFTASLETTLGPPRGQAHFFARDADAVPLMRAGVEGLLVPRAVEIDIDFNVIHESATECSYLGEPGRVRYERVWSAEGAGDAELAYAPAGC